MSQTARGLMTGKHFEETRRYSPHSCTLRQKKEWARVLNYEGNFLPTVTEEWWNTFQWLKIRPGSVQRRLTSHMCTEYSPSAYFRQTVAVPSNLHLTKRKSLQFTYLHPSQSQSMSDQQRDGFMLAGSKYSQQVVCLSWLFRVTFGCTFTLLMFSIGSSDSSKHAPLCSVLEIR